MAYKVGISSGWWNIAKDPNLLGLPLKAGSFGATTGVQFNQVDMETITEFVEPDLKDRFRRIVDKLGIEVGLHGEIGNIVALESAERRIWEQAHERLCIALKWAAELKMIYINIHLSQNVIVQQEEARIRPFGFQYQIVTPTGEPFYALAERSEAVKDFVVRRLPDRTLLGEESFQKLAQEKANEIQKGLQKKIDDEIKKRTSHIPNYEQVPPNERRIFEQQIAEDVQRAVNEEIRRVFNGGDTDVLYEAWKRSQFSKYVLEAGEIDAYYAVAYDMSSRNDPLWTNIVGNMNPEVAYNEKPLEFNAAISAAYLEGHFRVKNHSNKDHLNGMNMVEWCEKHNLMLCMEMPHSQQGQEGLMRFFHPLHSQYLVRKIGSGHVRLCIDFEQSMAQNIDVDEMIKKSPGDFGKLIFLLHLGEPIPYFGTAHIPITIGGQGQEILYRWIYGLRKKGYKSGYVIFERGGGRGGGRGTNYDVFEESVKAIRQMVKYLDQDTEPLNLPPEFFGIGFENPDVWARQLVTMREHAWDPLQDVFIIPEEKHFFLGSSAVQKGKAQEWERRKFR
ncbi:MAG: hypothetical protein J4469_00990 [Candidatus Aenigmarchaeota archaeon]|nr:hypothetical protein [Candidatus Aenigmarchaeota archaeon]